MIADDLGIGDIGVFGNTSLPTPNIDRISRDGAILTQHLTAASVCTPSRAALMTGRLPIRSGMTTAFRNRVLLFVATTGGLPSNETTFAKVLKNENYSTALFGKWHLGSYCSSKSDLCHHPLNHGFDYFYGTPFTNIKDFGNDGGSVILSYFPRMYMLLSTIMVIGVTIAILLYYNNYKKMSILLAVIFIGIPGGLISFQRNIKTLNSIMMRNDEIIEQPIQLEGMTDRLVNEASKFIKNQIANDQQFLVVLNFIKVHTAHFPSKNFKHKSKFGLYGDCVMEMDYGVGRMLTLLEELKIKDDTLVYFSSDNGGHIEETSVDGVPEGGWNGIYRGGKGQGAMEGGIRVPTVAMWPNVIPKGLVIPAATTQMDLFATIHDILNISVPNDRIIDGKSILPLLKGQSPDISPHKLLFHYCGVYLHGVRYVEDESHVWKFYFYTPNYLPGELRCPFMCHCFGDYVIEHNPPLLYNIADDPSEKKLIESKDPRYEKLHQLVIKQIEAHKKSIDSVPSQFSFLNSIWRPHLQPCCNFPLCQCTEQ